jgi:hypothetical protein
MAILSKPSSAARTALLYITVGALTDVWSSIWYAYLRRYPPANDTTWFWCYGCLLTGLTLFVIGLALGRIGRAARHAELPPEELTPAVANVDQQLAPRAPVITPVAAVSPPVHADRPSALPALPVAQRAPHV